ncbi:hypothetical protein [Phaeobacter phage MD18]|nr:hypothetical protein [Phaeobacter phage MD18]
MAIVFASNDAADFDVTMETHTDTNFFDPSLLSRGMRLASTSGSSNPFGITLSEATTGDMWMHFRMSHPGVNGNADGTFLSVMDASGVDLAEFNLVNGEVAAFAYGDSNMIGSYAPLGAPDVVQTFDVKIAVGVNIEVEMYIGGALMTTATVPNSGGKLTPRYIRFDMRDFAQVNAYYYFSEFIIADGESTLGLRLSELRPNTDGTYMDGVGTTASLSDGNSATGVTLGSVGQKRSWTPTAYAGPASPAVHSVISSAAMRIGGGDITKARHFLRIGGADYPGADKAPPEYVGPLMEVWSVNPATGLPWAEADLSGFEAGFEARP